jgi:hypothetical protein
MIPSHLMVHSIRARFHRASHGKTAFVEYPYNGKVANQYFISGNITTIDPASVRPPAATEYIIGSDLLRGSPKKRRT